MLDPGRKRSKISASSIKFYLGADSQANLDMVPSHEKKFVKPARAGDEESKAPDTRSAQHTKALQKISRKVMIGF